MPFLVSVLGLWEYTAVYNPAKRHIKPSVCGTYKASKNQQFAMTSILQIVLLCFAPICIQQTASHSCSETLEALGTFRRTSGVQHIKLLGHIPKASDLLCPHPCQDKPECIGYDFSQGNCSLYKEETDSTMEPRTLWLKVVQGPTCPTNWTLIGPSCYLFVMTAMSWQDAKEHCEGLISGQLEANLVTLETTNELDLLKTELDANPDFHVNFWTSGKNDDRTVWKWYTNNETIGTDLWAPQQPSVYPCVQMSYGNQYQLQNTRCGNDKQFICEIKGLSCHTNWTLIGESCYLFVMTPMPWQDAKQHCEGLISGQLHANLVSLETEEELDLLKAELDANPGLHVNFWTSGNNPNPEKTGWEWSTNNKTIGSDLWIPGRPTVEPCVHMWYSKQYKLDDTWCGSPRKFICETRGVHV